MGLSMSYAGCNLAGLDWSVRLASHQLDGHMSWTREEGRFSQHKKSSNNFAEMLSTEAPILCGEKMNSSITENALNIIST